MKSLHHIAYPHTAGMQVHFHWRALCGDPTAALFSLYPQSAAKGYKQLLCQDCLKHPDYALLLLAGRFND